MLDHYYLELLVLLSNQQVAFIPFHGPISLWGADIPESSIDILSGTLCGTVALQEPAGALAVITSGVHILIWHNHSDTILIPKRCEVLCALDCGLLASGGIDGEVCIWNVFTGNLVWTLTGHTGGVHLLAAMPNNKLASSSSYRDKTVRVWDMTTGQCDYVLKTENDLRVLVALDCKLVAFDAEGNKYVWV